ncbi:MAG: DNA-directed RNA polymerase subunit delta [Bacilli bacterium]|nr:DNA-directed RNA polymerase subunit delta [Bacilli bacterium]
MKIKDYTKEELESMNYDDIAYIIMTGEKRKLKINDLFKKVCNALKLDDNTFEQEIGNFFELMSTDKRFIMLDNGSWDLKERHNPKMMLVDEEEDIETELEEENVEADEEEEKEDENIFYDDNEDQVDDDDDDLKDFAIVDEDETNSL